jgi:N-acetylmuramoyl-L-alanine amidase
MCVVGACLALSACLGSSNPSARSKVSSATAATDAGPSEPGTFATTLAPPPGGFPDSLGPPPPTSATVPPTTAPKPVTAGSGRLAGRIIVVDPGHNGANGAHPEIINKPVDAGGFTKECNTTGTATDGGYSESAFNFAVGTDLQARLQAMGATVVMTRTDDRGVGPCVDQRGLTAQRAHADLLLSVHADGAPAGGHGFHVAHPGVIKGYTDSTATPSNGLAVAVRDALVAGGFTPSTYFGQQGLITRTDLGTLNRAGVPAVMTELGNMRNAADAAMLQSTAGQARLADALAAGIAAYLSR